MPPEPIPNIEAVQIRRYRADDRAAIRRIAADTADRGEPVDRLCPDRELVADLLTGHYLDYEPEATWVAWHQEDVVGYLTGCLDTVSHQTLTTRRILPAAVLRSIGRGMLGSRQTWQWFAAAMRMWRAGAFHAHVPLSDYPAHLHLNLLSGARGHGIGGTLVARFLDQARSAGRLGVHAAVRDDNQRSCRFFERLGFAPIAQRRVVFPEGDAYAAHQTIFYGKTL